MNWKDTPCILWKAAKTGYPWNGIHRKSYEYNIGPIPENYDLDHLCRTRNCINPFHLEPVTRQENMRRALQYRPDLRWQKCKWGHLLTVENINIWRGHHRCRTCDKATKQRQYKRRKDILCQMILLKIYWEAFPLAMK